MAVLKQYNEFAGRHMETGTVRNALAYQGVKAPHTGKPVSEALLLGVSGGAAFGYFTFEYSGYLPHIVLLTRNTFSPLETLLERLAIPQDILRTANLKKGEANLLEVLEGGRPALVWADMFSLPYNDLPYNERNWGMTPVLAYGYEDGTAYLADRSGKPIRISADDLNRARGRVKKDEYRVVMLDAPDWSRLPSAVSQGIWQCVSLYTETPPRGKRDNFGLAALQNWAKMLTNTRNKQSWARYFPPGERMWMALVGDRVQPGSYGFLQHGSGNTAERGMYADFLDEAAVILNRPVLKEAAQEFRRAEGAWSQLCDTLLPDDVPVLKEAKDLLNRKYKLFIEQGADALDDIRNVNVRLQELREAAAKDFPLSEAEATAFRERLAEQVLAVHAVERSAVECLQAAMG